MDKNVAYFSLAVACLMVGSVLGYRVGLTDGKALNVCPCRVDEHIHDQHDHGQHDQGGNGKPLPIRPISPGPVGSPGK